MFGQKVAEVKSAFYAYPDYTTAYGRILECKIYFLDITFFFSAVNCLTWNAVMPSSKV